MKGCLITVVVLAVLAIGGYFWWQGHAKQVLEAQLQGVARSFFENPENLKVEHSSIKLTGWRAARATDLTVAGKDLKIKDGPALAEARLALKDIDITGPPFRYEKVGGGDFSVKATDAALSAALQQRNFSLTIRGIGVSVPIPAKSVQITFPDRNVAQINATFTPPIGKDISLSAKGSLVPTSDATGIDFRPDPSGITVMGKSTGGFSAAAADAIAKLNPVLSTKVWPLATNDLKVETSGNMVTLKGKVTGARPSFGL